MSDPNSPVRIADTVLGETFQGNLPLYIALEGHQSDRLKDPVLLAKLDRLQTVVEQDPIVGGSLSLAEYIKRMNRVMNEDQPEMEVIPDSQDLIARTCCSTPSLATRTILMKSWIMTISTPT